MDPYIQQCSFQNLLNSQQPNSQWNESVEYVSAYVPREPYQSFPRESYQSAPPESVSASDASVPNGNDDGNENAKTVTPERKERRKWSPTEDCVLISSWLNTSRMHWWGMSGRQVHFGNELRLTMLRVPS
ncbi:hypothetical protein YC2023_040105 [Brassica napus]|uniref:Myb-like domain-containing protein n=1 Tax=Brassica oleracea TaxID=3712 RepID=A0A3P6BEA6_BRAOL|nr:unnamed protein product [Brassica oleracea]